MQLYKKEMKINIPGMLKSLKHSEKSSESISNSSFSDKRKKYQ